MILTMAEVRGERIKPVTAMQLYDSHTGINVHRVGDTIKVISTPDTELPFIGFMTLMY
jgi:hypothetical protein